MFMNRLYSAIQWQLNNLLVKYLYEMLMEKWIFDLTASRY